MEESGKREIFAFFTLLWIKMFLSLFMIWYKRASIWIDNLRDDLLYVFAHKTIPNFFPVSDRSFTTLSSRGIPSFVFFSSIFRSGSPGISTFFFSPIGLAARNPSIQ